MWQIINGFICLITVIIGVYFFGNIVLNIKPNISKKNLIYAISFAIFAHTIIFLNLEGTIKTIPETNFTIQ